jgi:hypothetical protein
MRKRHNLSDRSRLTTNNKRRLMIKRLHKKVLLRRQQYQQFDSQDSLTDAS